jgi:hypothetical protein
VRIRRTRTARGSQEADLGVPSRLRSRHVPCDTPCRGQAHCT